MRFSWHYYITLPDRALLLLMRILYEDFCILEFYFIFYYTDFTICLIVRVLLYMILYKFDNADSILLL